MTAADQPPVPGDDAPSAFLSYSRGDRKRAIPLIAALEQAGIKLWWDGLLEGGDTFLPTTEAALESADAVIVLWSKTSIESHWVRDEATRGRDRRCLVPLSLDGSMPPLGFRQFQVIDISKWRGKADAPEITAILRAVTGYAGRTVERAPVPKQPVATSRRTILIGGGVATAAVIAGGLAWRTGLIGGGKGADNSIAVIPFRNLGGDPAHAYFSDGLSEELRATLARNTLLRIAAPTSSATFRDASDDILAIAKSLGVALVLRGSVRHDGRQLRVAAELVRAKDARLEWTQTLNRSMTDVLALQTEIATSVARALSSEMNAQAIAQGRSGDWLTLGGTRKAGAFDAYLRGKALMDSSSSEEVDRAALALLDEAVTIDPGYAIALSARSKILAVIANQTGQASDVPRLYDRAVSSAQAAIKAAPELAGAQSALGYALYNGRLDPRAARDSYDRSRVLGAGDADVLRAFALFCAYTGRPGDAAEAMDSSLALDPLNPGAFRAAGHIAYARRDYAQTEAKMRRALELSPNLSIASYAIGAALYLTGRHVEAVTAFSAEPIDVFRLQGLAIAQRKAGDQAAAGQAMAELVGRLGATSGYQQAQVLAQWGNQAGALARLQQAAKARDSGLLLAPTDPMLDPLRTNPQFGQLLSTLRLS